MEWNQRMRREKSEMRREEGMELGNIKRKVHSMPGFHS